MWIYQYEIYHTIKMRNRVSDLKPTISLDKNITISSYQDMYERQIQLLF